MGKRQNAARRAEDRPGYVDLYHPSLFFVLLLIILFSLADAYWTLEALSAGCREVNPAMNAALGLGKTSFIAIKIIVTGLGVTLLCMHKSFPKVKLIIFFVLLGYVILLGYHLYLMQFR